jgi:hypothetical protein
MIPVVKRLQELNHNVIIGSGEEHLSLFRIESPGLTYIEFAGFKPGYSRYLPQYAGLLLKIPLLFYHILLEHARLKKIIRKYDIDIVISDNRFGLWNRKIKTVYVTHMPLIPFPQGFRFMEPVGVLLHRFVIKKYSLCFIPDLPGLINLTGRLTHGINLPENVRYIGILSRFTLGEDSADNIPELFRHNTVILSGPEPQRQIFKQKLTEILKDGDMPTVMLEGKPGKPAEYISPGNIYYLNHLPAQARKGMLISSESIITRSGYTTIMELLSLNCSALLIPTPGQTEQEYLAGYLSGKGWFSTISQDEIDKGINLPSINSLWPGDIIEESKILFSEALKELLEEDHKKSQPEKSSKKAGPNLLGIM